MGTWSKYIDKGKLSPLSISNLKIHARLLVISGIIKIQIKRAIEVSLLNSQESNLSVDLSPKFGGYMLVSYTESV